MATPEVVAKTICDERANFLREAVAIVAAQLMETEITTGIGVGHDEVSSSRTTHRNGYGPRIWETRVGEIELLVPTSTRGRAAFPSFLAPRRPCKQALLAVVMKALLPST